MVHSIGCMTHATISVPPKSECGVASSINAPAITTPPKKAAAPEIPMPIHSTIFSTMDAGCARFPTLFSTVKIHHFLSCVLIYNNSLDGIVNTWKGVVWQLFVGFCLNDGINI